MKFDKVLAKSYEKWYRNCTESVVYCTTHNIDKVDYYKAKAIEYFDFINEHWDDIDFYRIGDNAFYTPEATERKRAEWELTKCSSN
jgi:hypothetical protein